MELEIKKIQNFSDVEIDYPIDYPMRLLNGMTIAYFFL